jgi:hypothetical protein
MTKDEFIARQQIAKRASPPIMIWMVILFAAMIGNLPFLAWLREHHLQKWINPVELVLYGLLFGSFVLMLLIAKVRLRKLNLVCPACGKPLAGNPGQIAIATGNCGHCGSPVFENVENGV